MEPAPKVAKRKSIGRNPQDKLRLEATYSLGDAIPETDAVKGNIDMSGPIVRRYGFPNFDEIFGKKELEHGVDEPESSPTEGNKSPSQNEKEAPAPEEKDKPKG